MKLQKYGFFKTKFRNCSRANGIIKNKSDFLVFYFIKL